jgi:hypothetical protein
VSSKAIIAILSKTRPIARMVLLLSQSVFSCGQCKRRGSEQANELAPLHLDDPAQDYAEYSRSAPCIAAKAGTLLSALGQECPIGPSAETTRLFSSILAACVASGGGQNGNRVNAANFFGSIFRDPVADLETHCNKIATASPGNVQQIAQIMLQMLVEYYRDVRWQALLSFLAAFVLELIAVVLFFMASHKAINHEIDSATVMALSGAGVQIMTAVVFYFYAQSARQFAGFHICLDRTNRFLLANAILENLPEGPDRNAKRGEVVTTVLNASMPTLS